MRKRLCILTAALTIMVAAIGAPPPGKKAKTTQVKQRTTQTTQAKRTTQTTQTNQIGGTCGDNCSWSYNPSTKKLTISGKGEMYDYPIIEDYMVGRGLWATSHQRTRDIPWDEYCSQITSVNISGVTFVGYRAFHSCSHLTSINVDGVNANYSSVDGVLFNKDKTTLIQYPAGKQRKVYIIPNNVTTIGKNAFANCSGLKKLIIEDGTTALSIVNYIQKYTLQQHWEKETYSTYYGSFDNCNIDTLYLGRSITYAEKPSSEDEYAATSLFGTALKQLIIGSKLTSLPDYAFSNCTGLTGTITINDGVTYIGKNAFANCSRLTSLTIPDGGVAIGEGAFNGCTGITSLTLSTARSTEAQTTPRSFYVSANGNDDNNGRSEDAPFRTFAKAAEVAVKGTIKTITILGTLSRTSAGTEGNVFSIENNGTAEILIRGKSDTEKAFLAGGSNKGRVVYVSGKGAVRFENVEISGGNGNGLFEDGGGIYIEGSTVTLGKGVKISGSRFNYSAGGGVYLAGGTLFMLNGAVITDNYGYRGGGMCIAGGTFIMAGGIIHDNGIGGNIGGEDGGGVYVNKGTFILADGEIRQNGGRKAGGGVHLDEGYLTMFGGAISENNGGGVRGGVVISGGEINGNTGRGVTGNVTISGGSISGNASGGDGGGVNGNVTMIGGEISDNTAERSGGGVYGNISMSNGIISNNTAKGSGGGVMGDVSMSGDAAINDNTAGGSGGGVYGTVAMRGGTINGNRATGSGDYGNGGGIRGNATLLGNAVISDNSATRDGGGVAAKEFISVSGNASISGNTAGRNGGGISSENSCEIEKGSVTNNIAKKNGGGIWSPYLSISKSEVSGNKAEYGSGAYIQKSFKMSGGKITGNGAEFVGGGVYVESGAEFVQGSGVISGNTAGDGEGENVFRQQ